MGERDRIPWLYRRLLRLLPAPFRRRQGDEMARLVRDRRPPHGLALRYWARECLDLVRTVAREWMRRPGAPRGEPSPRPRPRDMLRDTLADALYSARTLIKRPLYTGAVLLILAVGIAAVTTTFSVVDAVLLRSLPFDDPERLVLGFGAFELNDRASVSPPDFLDYRERADAFDALGAMTSYRPSFDLTDGDRPERVRGRWVSHELLDLLGVEPVVGRDFVADEEGPEAASVVMLGHGLWQRRFGGDPGIVGRTIRVDGREATVVGVLPAGHRLFTEPDILQPIPFRTQETQVRRFHFLRVIGRLGEGVGLEAAQRQLDGIAADLAAAYPDSNEGWRLRIVPLREAIVGDAGTPLLVLLGASAAVLLIVCCNVAVMLLARTTRRGAELALRGALGASRGRIVRLVLAESLLLAVLGGGFGLLLAVQATASVRAFALARLPRAEAIAVEPRVVLVALGAAVLTGVAVGLLPALRATRGGPAPGLGDAGRSTGARGRRRLRSGLVVGQVALSLTLLVGAGLFLRSLQQVHRVDPGFEPEGLLSATVSLPETRYPERESVAAFLQGLLERLEAGPGVEVAAAVDVLPFTGANDTFLYPEGDPPAEGDPGANAQFRFVTPGYFRAMGIPLRAGRAVDSRDVRGGEPVVVIDEPLASSLFPEGEALGRRLVIDLGEPVSARIVGVVSGVHHFSLEGGRYGTLYMPHAQFPRRSMSVVLRTAGEPAALTGTLRRAVAELDPELPLSETGPVSDLVAASLAQRNLATGLLGAFGGVALLLAAVGLYGVLAYSVGERRRELGVRMALGAEAGSLLRLVLGRGMALVGAGLALGLLGALAATRLVSSQLFGVGASDPVAFGVTVAILLGVGLAASLLPAVRATRVDPVEVLRSE